MDTFLVPLVALVFGILGIISLKRGAVFLPTHREAVSKMLEMARVGPGDRAVDLGSGDGRIVIAMARAGAEAHGYEHNSLLVWWSRFKIRRAGLSGKAFIHRTNFWIEDFSKFDVVTVFGITYIMKHLEGKLTKELRPGSRVVSYTFPFPAWKPNAVKKEGIYFYKK